jgi:hypothetical protein
MSPRRPLVALCGCVLAACLLAAPARADDAEAQARELFRQGVELHEKRDFAAALDRFRAAYALWQNPLILPNLGTAAWEAGHYAEAAEAYDRYLAQASAAASDRADVESALGSVLSRVGTLAVVAGAGARLGRVTVDGRVLDEARLDRVRVEPGTHRLQASFADGRSAARSVEVAAGATLRVVLEPPPSTAPGARPAAGAGDRGRGAAAGAPPPAPAAGARAEPAAGAAPWIAAGVGVAGLAASGVFFLLRGSAAGDLEEQCVDGVCPGSAQETIDRGDRMGLLGAVALGVGVAGAGVAVVLFAGGGDGARAAARPALELSAATRGGGGVAALGGRF